MTTKFVGIKDFRQNIASYTKEAHGKKMRYIILKKNVPVLEVFSINEIDFASEKLRKELDKAAKKMKSGKFYTQEEVMKEFGLL